MIREVKSTSFKGEKERMKFFEKKTLGLSSYDTIGEKSFESPILYP